MNKNNIFKTLFYFMLLTGLVFVSSPTTNAQALTETKEQYQVQKEADKKLTEDIDNAVAEGKEIEIEAGAESQLQETPQAEAESEAAQEPSEELEVEEQQPETAPVLQIYDESKIAKQKSFNEVKTIVLKVGLGLISVIILFSILMSIFKFIMSKSRPSNLNTEGDDEMENFNYRERKGFGDADEFDSDNIFEKDDNILNEPKTLSQSVAMFVKNKLKPM